MSDITRQKTIDYLYYLKTHYPKNLIIPEYIDFAISSLETDEAYQLEYESTPKNNLGVDAISRADALSLICDIDLKRHLSGMSRKAFKDLYNGIDELPSVTPQLSSGTRKNSQKLEKDFGELDCISRADAIGSIAVECSAENSDIDYAKFLMLRRAIKALPSVTPQEPRWIPVSEKMPEKTGMYLISIGDWVTVKSFDGYNFRTESAVRFMPDAWMPLPEPFEPQESEG